MAGRPALRIGAPRVIVAIILAAACGRRRCRYRDSDGVTRECSGWGRRANTTGTASSPRTRSSRPCRNADTVGSNVGLEPLVSMVDLHLARLAEDGAPLWLSTYRFAAGKLTKFIGGVRVGEASPARFDAALRSMRTAHGATMARQAKTILRGGLQLAVMANVLGANPVRDVQPFKSKISRRAPSRSPRSSYATY